jgi:hypothetical protein
MSFLKAAGLFPFLSPEQHNYPNYYHHRNPRSPYDIDRSPAWYVQKLCHHYCEPVNPSAEIRVESSWGSEGWAI